MKILTRFLLLIFLSLVASFPSPVQAATEPALPPAPLLVDVSLDFGSALCAPTSPPIPEGCPQLGPAAYNQEMVAQGVQLPYGKLSVKKPDPMLGALPFNYGRVVTPGAPVYGSAEAAASQGPVLYRLEPGFNYISYTYTDIVNEIRVYNLAPGVWMNALDVHRVGIPYFQGVEIVNHPRAPFGWVLQTVEARRGPGWAAPANGNIYNRFDMVQVYDTVEMDNYRWVQVSPTDWLPFPMVAHIIPMNNPPEGVDGSRWIDINLEQQTVAVYDDNRLVFATVTSTGVDPYWTRPGLFQIYQKLDTTPMTGAFAADRSDYYFLMDVPWTMYFDQARAIHGAYWHTFFGYTRSHGCVNLSPGDSNWLYRWAEVGDWVYVHDPSGMTPTDPSFYGEGGA